MVKINSGTVAADRIFVACPMSSFPTELLYQEFRAKVLRFCDRLATATKSVFFAGANIGSFVEFDGTSDAMKTDADRIWECDRFVLLYPERILSSALVEVGIAIGLRKPVTIVCRDRADLPYVLQSADVSSSERVGSLLLYTSDFSDAGLADIADAVVQPGRRQAAE